MKLRPFRHRPIAVLGGSAACAFVLAAFVPLAQAQPTSTTAQPRSDSYSLLPGTRRGYAGINLGQSDYSAPCGLLASGCDNKQLAGKVYTGGMFTDHLGAEIGYLHMGRAERAGGRTTAQGLNLSLLGRVPIDRFNVFGKVGTTYGRTRVSAQTGSGIAAGSASGWGLSYGVGAGYDFATNSGVVLEWERHRFRFAGSDKRDVDALTLGYVHRF